MKTEAGCYHVPVMLRQTLEALNVKPDGIYVDVTFGGGGHSRAILERLGPQGRLFAFDQDADAAANVPQDEPRMTFVMSNFRYLKQWLRYYDVDRVDGVLADLGVSSHHFDEAERGFSFREDGPLDMRMNRKARLTAADVVNQYEAEQLANVFYYYGELRQARSLAAVVAKRREQQPLTTVGELMETVSPVLGHQREKKELAKVFQALRIEVNQEMTALRDMLESVPQVLCPGGRLVVLTYHSLEDRLVKNVMRAGNAEGHVKTDFYGNRLSPLKALGKPLQPSVQEQGDNPRSRSAKLRVAERVSDSGAKNGK